MPGSVRNAVGAIREAINRPRSPPPTAPAVAVVVATNEAEPKKQKARKPVNAGPRQREFDWDLLDRINDAFAELCARYYAPRRLPPRPTRRWVAPGLRRGRGSVLTNRVLDDVYDEIQSIEANNTRRRQDRPANRRRNDDERNYIDPVTGYYIGPNPAYTFDPNRDYEASSAAFWTRASSGAYAGTPAGQGNRLRLRGGNANSGNTYGSDDEEMPALV